MELMIASQNFDCLAIPVAKNDKVAQQIEKAPMVEDPLQYRFKLGVAFGSQTIS